MNIYIDLTHKFNYGKLRAVICSGQAVVLHKLAIMSKDGDWIIKEDEESLNHILNILNKYNAKYRFGAPLDLRWLREGWSSHFEFKYNKLRVRTDFFSRPPRLNEEDIKRLWEEHKNSSLPYINTKDLVKIKMTNREKDYVVIGELARLMKDPKDQLLYSRSARDLISLSKQYPELVSKISIQRELLNRISDGREKIEELIDKEKRNLIHQNEKRLGKYINASLNWANEWLLVKNKIKNLDLLTSHKLITERAKNLLPFKIKG